MNELVRRLSQGRHRLVYARAKAASDLKEALDRKYALLKFPETRGGTELGMPLDLPACKLEGADFEKGRGTIHLEGDLELDYVAVRLVADLDLATLEGEGHLVIREERATKKTASKGNGVNESGASPA